MTFRPYDGVGPVTLASNGSYRHHPKWYRNFLYVLERERGLDDTEDLASPGQFSWALSRDGDTAVLTLRARPTCAFQSGGDVARAFAASRRAARIRRGDLGNAIDRAADAYLVRRGAGRTRSSCRSARHPFAVGDCSIGRHVAQPLSRSR